MSLILLLGDRSKTLNLLSNQTTLQQVSMTLAGMSSGTIDWGDGNTTTIPNGSEATYTHDYASTGYYVVRIGGKLDELTHFYSLWQDHWEFDIAEFIKTPNLLFLHISGSHNVTGDLSAIKHVTRIVGLYECFNIVGDIANLSNATYVVQVNKCAGVYGDITHCNASSLIRVSNTMVNEYTPKVWTQKIERLYAENCNLSSETIDQLLIDLSQATWAGSKVLELGGNNQPRTSASDSAVATLISKGVTVTVNE